MFYKNKDGKTLIYRIKSYANEKYDGFQLCNIFKHLSITNLNISMCGDTVRENSNQLVFTQYLILSDYVFAILWSQYNVHRFLK